MVKKILPHIVSLLIFIVVIAIYFAPQYEGKAVRQSDDIQAKGMAGGINEHKELYGEHPQWAPNMFGGMPAYLIDMNYEGRYVKESSSALYFMGRPAAYYFILMAGFYFMLLCFGVAPALAVVGSLAYGFSSYFVIIFEAGHITKLMALSFIAPLIGAIYYAYRKNLWLGAALAGILASIELSTSHPQITYYFLFVIIGLIIVNGVYYFKQKQMAEFWKRSAVLLVAATLAISSNAVQLWYISDYAGDSIRGASELTSASSDNTDNHTSGLDKDYATAWSYGKAETFNLFIPNLMGGSSSGGFASDGEVAKALGANSRYATMLPGYWGDQPMTSGPVYIGAIVIFLFVLGLFLVGGAIRWWLLSVTLLSIMLAWGRNFMWLTDLFLDYFPMYNKFRVVSMILVIAQWSMPLLGILALKEIWDKHIAKEKFYKALKYSVGITVGIAAFFWVFGSGLFDFASEADYSRFDSSLVDVMASERMSMMRSDAFRSIVFILLSSGVLLLYYRNAIKGWSFAAILSTLVLMDMVPVDMRYLSHEDFIDKRKAVGVTPTDADKQIMQDKDPNFRVINLTVSPFNDATTSYFHKSIGGYHAAKMRRYQDVIDKYLSKMDMEVYNMLNTKYFIVEGEGGVPVAQINPEACGPAWFVDSVMVVSNADEELLALGGINPSICAVVDARFGNITVGAADSSDTITLTDYKVNHLTYNSVTADDRLAVFSEIYYNKGWEAFIDGQKVDYLRADYILRALLVPKGNHTIEFKFAAPNFGVVKAITIISSLILMIGLVLAIAFRIRKKTDNE